ncbi:bifunctional diaminohydroxyphosphoribosylaminopyrimidine deaminase/5-amino-6-(5-phosphoribosylamino)uracil reductase RibD [Helicobacter cappadocius]|uniref:Bifunctional diaminohydroxyphosphoribosylaminopyrimidine deaminase/5-amino-6-(5-phosphoribosylamino)uracil reductase RibD n=1 Tax=Helicobacter cappadocius TaxID=3063998 RepID=A0AA90T4H5_9HELI|nr:MULTISPECIES: bifunctional diaminohydroxyphosphoribosylaminopyrimidine deaminase/5-amino-6-(5-phosphoribosylamino)uracil reductase RibD [unclassified Helicobacter]MDO7252446.1 bifunctional diaminohydroxyphosphoribosylaminopyrimidine deaminase/5-amino-6-(5-phosphoribosylamino)uracil reductase RibD [Helicobacter sp. faydin-H75]MDP2538313.1 bifunctional diaminohydroxyphosphoribosylaminopyrimidine deaminase/5-amino-6-(5-phosphoribosylamino)uracil reductase RibD [Helicobacter sp. faydin-H76]
MSSDEYFLSLCIQEAWKYQSLTLPNPAVGAMVVDGGGNILSVCAHTKAGSAHAEVNALKNAYEKLSYQKCNLADAKEIHHYLKANHQGIFNDCTIYVTLEPCNHYGKTPPCAELIETIRPKRVVIGSSEIQKQASGGAKRLQDSGIEVVQNVLEFECNALLYPFLCLKERGHFNLFKIAQRINGDYQSGLISGMESRVFTHNQRCVADTLIISGKTLRVDRPTLDVRYCTKEYANTSPNIQILTKEKSFYDAPLFKVPCRKVDICHQIEHLKLQKGFNVIEGGWDLFESLHSFVDMVLVYISPTLKQNIKSKGFEWNAELLYIQKLGNDGLLWIKKS